MRRQEERENLILFAQPEEIQANMAAMAIQYKHPRLAMRLAMRLATSRFRYKHTA